MTIVYLPSSLRDLVGEDRLTTSAGDLRALVRELESRHPTLAARVTDESGTLRPHVKIFVNGEQADLDREVSETDEVRILPAISGGSDETELLVGTRKGLIVLRGERGGSTEVAAREFEGKTVEFATYDRATETYLASVTDDHFGPRIFFSEDATKGWQPSNGPIFPDDTGAAVERIWTIEPGATDGVVYAGVAPAALFRSDDGGRTWALNRSLWNVPGRDEWQPGGGGLCLHSISPWPNDPSRLALAISAAGVWLTDDEGASWRTGYTGLVPRYIPEEAREDTNALCVHNIKRSPVRPETIYLQFHWGVYRSDDAGETWTDIGTDSGLPSDFGFPMAIDPSDPTRAFVIPLKGDFDRTTPDGKVQVFETTDSGATWSSSSNGLPQSDAYLTVLRQAFCNDDRGGAELGLYFGATSGDVFGSADGGRTWSALARHLPPVLSVRCSF
ncbi:MAG: MoaD/ThiS family protein [Actinomycetota bacterium]|nr:MoaD/ThiS family protein [Actinomycetota bacterium]